MNRLYAVLAAGSLLAGVAAAQDEGKTSVEKMAAQLKVVSVNGSVMGKAVKGAPYSGVEVNESTQMLADGTRIHNESQTQVFRDSEGRMRRETPNEITIWDPVANASYVLQPNSKTARKLPMMGNFVFTTNRGPGQVFTYSQNVAFSDNGKTPPAELEAKMVELKAKAEAEMRAHTGAGMGVGIGITPPGADNVKIMLRDKGTTEALGKRSIEGVNAEGTRVVSTVEAGAIGNDRAIQSVNERWFSPDLQTVMMTKHSDPRTGEESFKLINVNRAEPAAYLFQVPAGYQLVEQK
jgi:hypothetical protein